MIRIPAMSKTALRPFTIEQCGPDARHATKLSTPSLLEVLEKRKTRNPNVRHAELTSGQPERRDITILCAFQGKK